MAERPSRRRPIRQGHGVLTLELQQLTVADGPGWQLTCSVPHREGTFSRSWGRAGVPLDERAWEDMAVWVERMLLDAVHLHGGIQEVLPI